MEHVYIEVVIPDPKAFRADVEKMLADPTAAAEGAAATYCQVWPHLHQGLTLLQQIAPLIPGVGWMVSLAIPLVLAAGRAAQQSLCDGE